MRTKSDPPTSSHPVHTPQRTCIGCRTTRAKQDLLRVIWAEGEGARVDASGKARGRGAYLCAAADCWEKALGKNRLERALRSGTKISEENREALLRAASNLRAL